MARGGRTSDCTAAQAPSRLQQAEAFVMTADLVLGDDSDMATPGVAAAIAVLAGIAASDAACCARLGRLSRGQDHATATTLWRTVVPHGEAMAKDLTRLLASKDESHYGLTLVDRAKARRLVGCARRLIDLARDAVDGERRPVERGRRRRAPTSLLHPCNASARDGSTQTTERKRAGQTASDGSRRIGPDRGSRSPRSTKAPTRSSGS